MMSQDEEFNFNSLSSSFEDDMLSQFGMYDEDFDLAEILQERVDYYDFGSECRNLIQNCMASVLLQSVQNIQTLLICCVLFRLAISVTHAVFLSVLVVHYNVIHLLGIFLGCVSIISIESSNLLATSGIMISYTLIGYTLLYISSQSSYSCSRTASIFTVLFLIFGEYYIQNSEIWHPIRGILLLLTMKVISVSFDVDAGSIEAFPSLLSYLSYCMHCGTLLFGPWISYRDFLDSIECPKPFSWNWFYNITKSLLYSSICLLLSTCALSYLFIDGAQPESPSLTPFVANHWMLSYQSAVSFHFSHFYICFLSQATCLLSGICKRSSEDLAWSDFVVVKPLSVVVPFSMLSVVVDWNIPMSKWLKKYVFDVYKHLGQATAVMMTYTASAILHGLSFHLASVLLSLALYTYVEYTLRKKASVLLNCPNIQSRPQISGSEKVTSPWWAILFNIAWVIINIGHLAYLGSMFQSEDSDLDRQGYHMQHTLAKWRNLGFSSHIFAFVCLITSFLIPNVQKKTGKHEKDD